MVTTTTGIATEFIQFSRTSNATLTDSNGVIKWAPHNLLLASEQFDSASWTKTSITPTANAVAAPNGTTTADTLTASGANGTALQSYTSLGVPYTFGVWLKRKTGTGNIQIAADSGTYTTVTITSDWALYTVTQTPASGAISAGVRIVTSADAVEAWGAHLYRSDLGGMQANTSAYPMYNPTTPKNLLGFSESFGSWTQNGAPTITARADTAPNGLVSATLIQDTSSTLYQGVQMLFSAVSSGKYTGSIYVKKSAVLTYSVFQVARTTTSSWCGLILDTLSGTTSVITGGLYSAPDGYGVVDAGSYWRVWIRVVSTTTNASTGFEFYPAGSTDGTTLSASATGSATIWGAQLSDSASLDTYVPNYGAAPTAAAYYGPRLDADPVTLAQRGLLVEEQRTNLFLNSDTLATQNVTVTAVSHTLSFYGTGTITLTGVSTAGPLVGTGAYPNRVTLTFTPTAGTLTLTVTGSVRQAQLEAGSFATSYIPVGSTTAGATRNADVARVSTQAFPYSSAESSIVANVVPIASGNANILQLSAANTPFGLLMYQSAAVANAYVDAASASLGTMTFGGVQKIGLAYNGSTNGAVRNGGTVSSVGTTVSAPATRLGIGSDFAGGGTFNGHIRQITYIPRRLSDTELQTRTA